ncbi:hypothetical protein [Bradyrhizobium sp. Gha]|uniref:hypothetical protein n=1 Tax=Bradyrhizobium sp. Gha TaxID=1855318 RepID=UPI0008EC7B36|nr:hypothetical protein [Bradyrhizobium sp. Gha]SFI49653.1 hypothetical protein SAMN05216525_109168 [Bradyrhizobium sp. Gha]
MRSLRGHLPNTPLRPNARSLIDDASNACEKLAWRPERAFAQLVAQWWLDFAEAKREAAVASADFDPRGKSIYVAGPRGMVGSATVAGWRARI